MDIEFVTVSIEDFDEDERKMLEECMSDLDIRDVLTLPKLDEIRVELGLVQVH